MKMDNSNLKEKYGNNTTFREKIHKIRSKA